MLLLIDEALFRDEIAATTQRRFETATATKTIYKINETTGFEIQTKGTRTPPSQRKLPPPPSFNSLQEEFKGIFDSAKSVQIMATFITYLLLLRIV